VSLAPRAAGTVTVVTALLVLVGWAFDITVLKSIDRSFVTMKPNAAVAFLSFGLTLLLWLRPSVARHRLAISCAGLTAAIGLLTLAEYAHAPGIAIDHLLFQEGPNPVFTSSPGRMSPATAACFLLLGSAGMLLARTTLRGHWPSGILVGPVIQISLLALGGYAFGMRAFHGVGSHAAMALHTAVLFLVLPLALVCIRPQLGLIAILTSAGHGGIMARSFLGAALALPLVIGWLLTQGAQAGLFSTEFALAFFAMASIGSFAGLVWVNGFLLERMAEERRAQLEAAMRSRGRAFKALSACSEALVRATDEQALLDAVCRIFVEVGGYRMCWVGFAERDERKTVRPVAHAGHEEGYLSLVDAVWADTDRGRGPSGTAIRTRRPVVVGDVLTDPNFDPWRSEAVKRGYKSLAALPLVAEGAALGVLRIYSAEPGAFDDDEMKLVAELANNLAFGIAALRARAERDKMTAQLMLADRLVSIGTLAAGVAHEINNPLAYMVAAVDFLDKEIKRIGHKLRVDEFDELSKALADAREGAGRVKHVVRDLKTFSRVEEKRRSTIDLRPVIESSINMAFNEIKYRARLVKDYGRTPLVLANEARLGQVFLNLLINAAQAIPEGRTEENEIRVLTRTDDLGRAVAEVRDSGPGIPPEVVERIFDPFFTTKPPGVGTGLGLSICRSIVTALGGEIAVESQAHKGTVFRVVLPAAPIVPAEEARSEQGPVKPARRGRVLVVDDEPAIGTALRRVLAPEHDVTVLTSAAEARERIARGERFDVILCDLMMPVMTGMDLHAEITSLAPDQAERMVLVTGGAFTAKANEFLDQVPNARVEKPFDPATLLVLVRGLVR
jgi:signal transduction histidine kinase